MVLDFGAPSRILVYNPVFGFSHVKFLSGLADVMANAGHRVTVLQLFHLPLKNIEGLIKNDSVEIINYYPDNFEELGESPETFPFFWDSKSVSNPFLELLHMPAMLENLLKNAATKFMKNTKFHEELLSRNFDVMLYEPSDFTGAYFANLKSIPIIPVLSTVRMDFIDSLFGNPSQLGYAPYDFSRSPRRARTFDRLNDIVRWKLRALTAIRVFGRQQKVLEHAIGKSLCHWKALVADAPLLFVNSNSFLDFSVPSLDSIVKIGGIGMSKVPLSSKELSPEYKDILREREKTVLISFGSVITSHQMPETFKSGIIKMFENLSNITFIWKYEEEEDMELIRRLPKNVHLKSWVPQPALLADPRLSLFVTHGGLGSINELAYSGKPALLIPIFGDQFYNAAMLERHGGAVVFDKFDLKNGEKLTRVVKQLVRDSSYQESSEMLRELLLNQPGNPEEQFLERLEFAIKFPKFRSHHPEISKENVLKYYYLDAFVVIFVLFFLIVSIFPYLLSMLFL